MVIITQLNHVRPLQLDFERTWAIISVVVLVEVHSHIPAVRARPADHFRPERTRMAQAAPDRHASVIRLAYPPPASARQRE